MRDLDDTDLDILRLLLEDGRRPYSEIADRVGVSPPTVSDRVDRLNDLGVIRRFTLDVDRSLLDDGVEIVVDLTLRPGANGEVKKGLASEDAVEHVFATADHRIVATAVVPQDEVQPMLNRALDMDDVAEYDVRLLTDALWKPHVENGTLSLTCAVCGRDVTGDGELRRIEDDPLHFCSEDCLSSFEDDSTVVESR